MISSIRPHSPSTTTTSSTRIASVKAICMPANTFAEGGLRGEAGDDRDETRRGEQAGPGGARAGKVRSIAAIATTTRSDGHPPDHDDLGADPARVPVVRHSVRYRRRARCPRRRTRARRPARRRADERDQQPVLGMAAPHGAASVDSRSATQTRDDDEHLRPRAGPAATGPARGRSGGRSTSYQGTDDRGEQDGGDGAHRDRDRGREDVAHVGGVGRGDCSQQQHPARVGAWAARRSPFVRFARADAGPARPEPPRTAGGGASLRR